MRKKELDIDDDMQHEKHKWKIERISWVVLAAIILAAFTGLLGPGPISSKELESKSMKINYQMITRYESPNELEIQTKFIPDKDFTVWIDNNFLKDTGNMEIQPDPGKSYMKNGNSLFVFESSKDNKKPFSITFQFNHNKAGIKKLRTGIGNDFIEATQIILP